VDKALTASDINSEMDNVGNIGSRRRAAGNHYSAEEQALDQIAKEAESRLAARRQARAEAREIRMRELEKQQKEMEENADRQFEANNADGIVSSRVSVNKMTAPAPPPPLGSRTLLGSTSSFQSSRRGSEDSVEETSGQSMTIRDLRQELKELEEKFRKAMVQNAQLDNEKGSLVYQVELYKDKLEDMEEAYSLLQKEHKEKHRELEEAKRECVRMQQELNYQRYLVDERDRMIQEHGLVIVGEDEEDEDDNAPSSPAATKTQKKALVSSEVASLLEKAGEGSLDVRIRRLMEEKNELSDQLRRLKLDLEEEKSKTLYRERTPVTVSTPVSPNGPVADLTEWQSNSFSLQSLYLFGVFFC